jgi:outer membrane protein with beta-barrel domain
MKRMTTTTRFFTAAARRAVFGGVLLASSGLLMAQAPTQAGAIEVAGVFGAAAHLPDLSSALQSDLNQLGGPGFSVSGGSSFKWFAGGSFGYAISPNFLIVGETNYNHAGGATISYGGDTLSTTLSLTDFTGGIHWQLPVGSSKLVPYLAVAAGGTRVAASVSGSLLPASVSASSTGLTVNFGGGVRYYVRPSWGIRPEVLVVRIPGTTYLRFGVGVFWQSKS